jgi:DNA repair ATPase RecN
MPSEECWRDILLKLGKMDGKLEALPDLLESHKRSIDDAMAVLSQQMRDTHDICQKGHNRITRVEERLQGHLAHFESHIEHVDEFIDEHRRIANDNQTRLEKLENASPPEEGLVTRIEKLEKAAPSLDRKAVSYMALGAAVAGGLALKIAESYSELTKLISGH